ncbi:MAG: single-stranded-DNA-specific exonuclease RecJ [Breznakia sp.]
MKYRHVNTNRSIDFKKTTTLSPLACKVLASMDIEVDKIEEILYSKLTTNDFDLSFLDGIVKRIERAKANKEKILICGDYDCDGICATTILYDSLIRYGCDVGYYIPNRFKEGYGVNIETIKQALKKNYTLFITVDNGVKATNALSYAKAQGASVILSDHHAYEEDDLVYDYFLHPQILPSFYQNLSGAGLAYLLSKKIIQDHPYHTVLAGIATIGDMVGVLDANRILIKEAIQLLNTKTFLPIQLLQNNKDIWDATKIAFQIVPKINVFGRLADLANANMFVKYLLLSDTTKIKKTARQIHDLNNKRKLLSKQGELLALQQVTNKDAFIIVYDEHFHEGLNGIIAAKLVNQFHKPAMVLSVKDGIAKGSIRSVKGVDLTNFFDEIKPLLINYGGHAQAAGISLQEVNIEALQSYANKKMETVEIEKEEQVLFIDKEEVNITSIASLQCLEPFGVDFEKPKMCIEDNIIKIQSLSSGEHLKFVSNNLEYLYFFQGVKKNKYSPQTYRFVGNVTTSYFRGKKSITMIVEDVIK